MQFWGRFEATYRFSLVNGFNIYSMNLWNFITQGIDKEVMARPARSKCREPKYKKMLLELSFNGEI